MIILKNYDIVYAIMKLLHALIIICLLSPVLFSEDLKEVKEVKEKREEKDIHKFTTLSVAITDNTTAVTIQNDGLFPVSVTIDPAKKLTILTKFSFPYIGTIDPKQNLVFKLAGSYSLKDVMKWIYLKTGDVSAKHDDSYVYLYPFPSDLTRVITQANNSGYSHVGEYKYAVDWRMPAGTNVYAAREGTVVDTEASFSKNGLTYDYRSKTNYVLILHDDNTLAEYIHLQKDGVLCKIGQKVKRGDLIGKSGNTGYSTGPHLHFCVHRAESGTRRHSVPVKFNTK